MINHADHVEHIEGMNGKKLTTAVRLRLVTSTKRPTTAVRLGLWTSTKINYHSSTSTWTSTTNHLHGRVKINNQIPEMRR